METGHHHPFHVTRAFERFRSGAVLPFARLASPPKCQSNHARQRRLSLVAVRASCREVEAETAQFATQLPLIYSLEHPHPDLRRWSTLTFVLSP